MKTKMSYGSYMRPPGYIVWYSLYSLVALRRSIGLPDLPVFYKWYRCWGNTERCK